MPAAAATLRRPDSNRQERDQERRSVTINFRATEAWRTLTDHAAALMEKTRTDFIIEATRRQAEDVLLDQKLFDLDEARYQAFINILDNPPMPNEELIKLMNRKAPWQK